MGRKMKRPLTRRTFLKGVAAGAAGYTVYQFPMRAPRAAQPIVIGHQGDLTGVSAIFGFWNDRSAKAAVKKINSEGGVAGRKLKLVTGDTASDPKTGARAMRRMVLREGAAFILGTIQTGITGVSGALAKDLNVVYFPSDDVPVDPKSPEANRYVFRLGHNTRIKAHVSYRWAMERLGKKWSFVGFESGWGRGHVGDYKPRLQKAGGEVLGEFYVPIGTTDFVPALGKVNRDSEVLYHHAWGPAVPRLIGQAAELGLLKKSKLFASIGAVEGMNPKDLGPAAQGSHYVSELPRELGQIPGSLRAYNGAIRKACGVDELGMDVGGKWATTGEHYWVPWTNLHVIKAGVEASGWRNRDDNPKLIETLEGMEFKAGPGFPAGDMVIRPEDHRAFRDYYIEQVKGDHYVVVKVFKKEEGLYPPPTDLRKQGF
ncbi:MAG: ABC transporter substrate-binding protein [Nitrospinota bacterium]